MENSIAEFVGKNRIIKIIPCAGKFYMRTLVINNQGIPEEQSPELCFSTKECAISAARRNFTATIK